MSYHYYDGGNGRRFCYAQHATWRCPFQYPERKPSDPSTPITAPPTPATQLAAIAANDFGVTQLGQALRVAHNRRAIQRKRLDDGTLTDRCATCGAKLDKVGYAAWEEVVEERNDMARRLMGQFVRRVGETHYYDTKKKAIRWAQQNAQEARAGR